MGKKKIIITIVAVIVVLLGVYFIFWGQEEASKFETVRAEIRDLTQTVEETGKVKGREELELSFDRNGTLKANLVEEGERVKEGEELAELDYETLNIQKQEAEARLEAARLNLIKLRSGAAPSDVQVARSQLDQARENYRAAAANLEETRKTVNNSIDQAREHLHNLKDDGSDTMTAYEQSVQTAEQNLADTKETYREQISNNKESVVSTCDNSISVANTALDKIDEIINNDDLENLGVLSAKNTNYLTQTKKYYRESEELWQEAKDSYSRAKQDNSRTRLDQLLEDTLDLLDKTFLALDNCYQALENSITSTGFTSSELSAYKTTISQQITNINTAISSTQTVKHSLKSSYTTYNTKVAAAQNNLEGAQANLEDAIRNAENSLETAQTQGEQQITSAENQVETTKKSLEVARAQLNKAESPARQEDISLAEAEINQAQASLALIEEKIRNSIITAPKNGKVTKLNFEPGEQISMASPVVQMIAGQSLKIEVNISEVDITKIEAGDRVTLTLDAFSEDKKFYGQVKTIDPAETIIQDVVYYEVSIDFTDNNTSLEEVKPGMTANVTIHTEQKSGVLVVPSRAIIEKGDGQKIVRVPAGPDAIEEKPVETGLRGDNGLTEITRGLQEGEEVITYVEE